MFRINRAKAGVFICAVRQQLPPNGTRRMSARMPVGSSHHDVSIAIHDLAQEIRLLHVALEIARSISRRTRLLRRPHSQTGAAGPPACCRRRLPGLSPGSFAGVPAVKAGRKSLGVASTQPNALGKEKGRPLSSVSGPKPYHALFNVRKDPVRCKSGATFHHLARACLAEREPRRLDRARGLRLLRRQRKADSENCRHGRKRALDHEGTLHRIVPGASKNPRKSAKSKPGGGKAFCDNAQIRAATSHPTHLSRPTHKTERN